jgi:uncharacterized protein YqjF (DUF2071 family)
MSHRCEAAAPWVWDQHWRDVLFLHWQVPLPLLRERVPDALEIDTFAGDAWVSLVLFHLRVRPRWLPFVPGVSDLVEANLRTYVRAEGRPGIWFLSVHADNRLAMQIARWLTPMPYSHAPLTYTQLPDRRFAAASAAWSATFQTTGVAAPATGLHAWLLERYTLFLQDRRHRWLTADVEHAPWQVQEVALSFAGGVGLDPRRAPDAAHYSTGVRARIGRFMALRPSEPLPLVSPTRKRGTPSLARRANEREAR